MGLGAVGSAAAWRLAVAGHEVIGFDSWEPPHTNGSTHSESRMTRETAEEVRKRWKHIRASDIAPVTATMQRYFPRNAGAWLRGATCMYTVTPHGQFILDRHPEHPQVVLGSPCNGFGFKFSGATGEALAAMAVGDEPPVSISHWSLASAMAAGLATRAARAHSP